MKTFSLFLIFISSFYFSSAQELYKQKKIYTTTPVIRKVPPEHEIERERFRITTTPQQYFFLDFPFMFERVFKRTSVGITLSYRTSTKSEGTIPEKITGMGSAYNHHNFWNPLYKAFTIGLNSKYYLYRDNTLFIEGYVFYRRWWINDKHAEFGDYEYDGFKGRRTERQNVYGFKLFLGYSFSFKEDYKVKPIVDIYFGLGLRYKEMTFETFDGYIDGVYYDYHKETDYYFPVLPTPHFGIRVGIGID